MKRIIREDATRCIIGYTKDGSFGKVLIFFHGNIDGKDYDHFYAGEFVSFESYCTQHGAKYSLEVPPAGKTIEELVASGAELTYAAKIGKSVDNVIELALEYYQKHQNTLREADIKAAINENLSKFNISFSASCLICEVRSVQSVGTVYSEVELTLWIVTSQENIDSLTVQNMNCADIMSIDYDSYSSTCTLEFMIWYV